MPSVIAATHTKTRRRTMSVPTALLRPSAEALLTHDGGRGARQPARQERDGRRLPERLRVDVVAERREDHATGAGASVGCGGVTGGGTSSSSTSSARTGARRESVKRRPRTQSATAAITATPAMPPPTARMPA